MKAGQYAYRDRRNSKREFRQLWIARINAACRLQGVQYSRFIAALGANNVGLDRKVLADMAVNDIAAFNALVASLNITTPAPTHNISVAYRCMTPHLELERIAAEALDATVQAAARHAELDTVEVEYLGRKGQLTGLLRLVGTLPPDEKPIFGQSVNARKDALTTQLSEKRHRLSVQEHSARLASDAVDVTLPGTPRTVGRLHPLTQQISAVKSALMSMGYSFAEYPDIEDYHYNFETLNYPPDHPAFDEQMSFYVDARHLLRTQTTAFQAHVMEERKPPIRAATVGRCYRYEAVDATHLHTFHQVDLLAVDEGLTLADLKGTFAHFIKLLFGDVEIRFRPDFFPFVEPGVEVAIRWGSRWLELGGAGMVHPNILQSLGIDTERYTGFAWGLGVDRITMSQYGIDDIRLLFENDLRFLRQL